MIECESQGSGCEHAVKKILSGLQRYFTGTKLAVLLAMTFMLLVALTSLLYNSSPRESCYPRQKLQTTEVIYKQKYKRDEGIGADFSRAALSPKEMLQTRAALSARRKILEEYCRYLNASDSNLDSVLSNMIIDTEHGVSWCPIYKAASSTWMKHFAALGGTLTDMTMDLISRDIVQINTVVRQAFPRDPDLDLVQQKLNQTKKFLIVRHPLERIVSAYRDKLEHMDGREYYYKRFGRHIAHKYRRYREVNETKVEPTFVEFLRFIADEKYFDEHWAPFSETCRPCTVRYDYILKFDTFDRDQRFLIQELGLGEYLYHRGDLRNVNPRGATSTDIAKRYLEKVPKVLLDRVTKIYDRDFKLFSYLPT